MLNAILFIAALAGAPDTTECGVWRFTRPGQPPAEFVQVVIPAPPEIAAGGDTLDFRRPGEMARRPDDVSAARPGALQIDASLAPPEWSRCAVYLGSTLIGTFVVAPSLGDGRPRRGGHVEDGHK